MAIRLRYSAAAASSFSRRRCCSRVCCRKGLQIQATKAIREDRGSSAYASFDSSDESEETESQASPTRRVVLKISGEALRGQQGCGINPKVLQTVACEIAECSKEGYQIAIVAGGGNFFRGADAFAGIDRVSADNVGMLATTMNAICLASMLKNYDVDVRVQTAIEMKEVAEPYILEKAIRHLKKGRIVIFGAGTGHPFLTTDTAAVLRAAEIDADQILKATKVRGVFTDDPCKDPDARFLNYVTFDRAMQDDLRFMDSTAMSFCRERSIPVCVFSLNVPGNIRKAIRGEKVGSIMEANGPPLVNGTKPPTPLESLQNGRELHLV